MPDKNKVNEMTLEEMQAKLAEAETAKTEAIAARDRTSEAYRMQRSEADKLKNFAAKIKHTFEEKGLAKFDENLNVTIIEKKQEANTNVITEYDTQLSAIVAKQEVLTERFSNGDIDPDKFALENAKLLKEENAIARKKDATALKQELLEQQKQQEEDRQKQLQANQTQTKIQSEQEVFTNKLNEMFPDHNLTDPDNMSPIVKEVNAIIAEDPLAYDISSLNTNMKERYKIFKQAQDRMLASGKITKEELVKSQRATNSRFANLESGSYVEPKKQSSYVNDSMAGAYITNKFGKDTLTDINKRFADYEESGVLTIES